MVKELSTKKNITDKYIINGYRYNELKKAETKKKTNIQKGGMIMSFGIIITILCILGIGILIFFKKKVYAIFLFVIISLFWIIKVIINLLKSDEEVLEEKLNMREENEKKETILNKIKNFFGMNYDEFDEGDNTGKIIFFIITGIIIILLVVVAFVFIVNLILPKSKLKLSDKIENGLKINALNILEDNSDNNVNRLPEMDNPNFNSYEPIGENNKKKLSGIEAKNNLFFDINNFLNPPKINDEPCIDPYGGIAQNRIGEINNVNELNKVGRIGSLYENRIIEKTKKIYTENLLDEKTLDKKIKNYFSYVYEPVKREHLIFFKLTTNDLRKTAFGYLLNN